MAVAEFVQRMLARDAEFRFQTVLRIVNAGMDNLAVAGTGLRPDGVGFFYIDDVASRERERAGEGAR